MRTDRGLLARATLAFLAQVATLYLLLPSRTARGVDYNPVTFGAVGDTHYERDCSTTVNSGVVTCPSAGWVNGDVGKTFWCISPNVGVVNPLVAVTTIASRTSGTQITATAHANDTVGGVAMCAWGTAGDTAGIQAAVAAASSSAPANTVLAPPGRVLFPCGVFQVSDRLMNFQGTTVTVPQFVGGGEDCTTLILRPDMTIPGDGTATMIQVTGANLTFRDFTVQGLDMPFAWQVDQDMIRFASVGNLTMERVRIINLAGTGGGSASALSLRAVSQAYLSNIFIQGALANGYPIFAMKFIGVGNVTVFQSVISNFDDNLYIASSHGRTPTTAGFAWIGGMIDECFFPGGAGCLQLVDAEMSLIGATVYGNGAGTPITVDGTSRLWVSDSNVGAFNAIGDVPPIVIASGGQVVSRGTTWRNNGAAVIQNSGKFIEGAGNDYQSCSGNSCSPVSSQTAFGTSPGAVIRTITSP